MRRFLPYVYLTVTRLGTGIVFYAYHKKLVLWQRQKPLKINGLKMS